MSNYYNEGVPNYPQGRDPNVVQVTRNEEIPKRGKFCTLFFVYTNGMGSPSFVLDDFNKPDHLLSLKNAEISYKEIDIEKVDFNKRSGMPAAELFADDRRFGVLWKSKNKPNVLTGRFSDHVYGHKPLPDPYPWLTEYANLPSGDNGQYLGAPLLWFPYNTDFPWRRKRLQQPNFKLLTTWEAVDAVSRKIQE